MAGVPQVCIIDHDIPQLPWISSLTVTSPVKENEYVQLSGTVNHPAKGEALTVEVDWRDGTPIESYSCLSNDDGIATFSMPHHYKDDDPTGSPQDVYTIIVTV